MRLRLGRFAVFATGLALLFGTLSVATAAPALAGSAAINGGGSGFASLEIDQWRADTASQPYNLSVNYVSQGSSFGRQSFIGNNVDFGVSDITFQDAEIPALQQGRCGGRAIASCFVYVPVSAGGVSFMYNLTDSSGNQITNLRLTRQTACRIFTGAIQQWNDPQLVKYNPALASVNEAITPFIRADGAGESFVFSQYCIAVDKPDWDAFIADRMRNDPGDNQGTPFAAGQPTSNWPAGWGRSNPIAFADGVANAVTDPNGGTGSITYVAAGYAKVRNFPVASVQNAAGVFTQPDEDNVTVALGYAVGQPNGTFDLRFEGPDRRAYFPSTYSYVLAQTAGWDAGKGAALGQFLCYAVSKGQEIAPQLRYARLSSVLVGIAINSIVQIPGAPSAASCPVSGSAPPPPPPVIIGGGGGGNNQPGTNQPGSNQPGSNQPGSNQPGSNQPGSNQPGSNTTGTSAPGTVKKGQHSGGGKIIGADVATTTDPSRQLDTELKLASGTRSVPPGNQNAPVWLLLLGALAAAAFFGTAGALRKRTG